MTMCVFWKDQSHNIHVATDSRLNFNNNSSLDSCVKISRLKCDIYEPCNSSAEERTPKKSIELVITFCGGFTTAYTIKESLSEILTKIVMVPDTDELSLEKIVDLSKIVFENVSNDIFSALIDDKLACKFYIVGLCPKNKQMEAYEIGYQRSNSLPTFSKNRLFSTCSYEFSGSGALFLNKNNNVKDVINKAYLKNRISYPLDILQSVIDDKHCDSVGGAIQYAECTPNGNKIFGLLENKNGNIKYMRAGIDIKDLMVPSEDDFISGLYIEADLIEKSIDDTECDEKPL
ncbi:hypothetical protein [Providencia stuartii]|uniref:hypothetical protein n=1 Tax=Providencia stuartii TaxID=588 RepID=UPI0011233D42|nr:hypothetical protein [Providencia stuartii]